MDLQHISKETFASKHYGLWEGQWLLLTTGDFSTQKYNCMTIAWGLMGVMWNKPCAMVVVRPTRFTYEFMEQYPTFTLCAFPGEYRPALNLLGSRSGRDGDKIAAAGLTPVKVDGVGAPGYREAELIVACRKWYWSDIQPDHFIDAALNANYPQKDYHRMYLGEILSVHGVDAYRGE